MTPKPPSVGGQDIAQVAINDIGHCYVYGGHAGVSGQGCWDCSGACNWWIGAVWQQDIPGFPSGTYDGSVHGPSTLGWLGWQGEGVGSIDRDQAAAGDIACWRTHMGICISNTEMVSAANPTDGTIKSRIDGFIEGEQLIILRLAVIGPGGITLPTPTIANTSQLDAITRQVAKSSRDLVWKRMQVRSILTKRF